MKIRLVGFSVAASGLAALLLWGAFGLPGFGKYPGPYGDIVNATAVSERNVTNVPTAVNFDYRALDTMGEEFILFASAAALALLLRKQWEELREKPEPAEPSPYRAGASPVVEWLGSLLAGPMAIFGLYTVYHGMLTPGGGFHGGVIVASAALLVFLTRGTRAFHFLIPQYGAECLEALAAGGYVLIGIAGLLMGAAVFENALPLGQAKTIAAGGTIALLNLVVGVEVACAFALSLSEFIQEILQQSRGKP